MKYSANVIVWYGSILNRFLRAFGGALVVVVSLQTADAVDFNVYNAVYPTGSYPCASRDKGAVNLHVAQGNQPNGSYSVLDNLGHQLMAGNCVDGVCSNNDTITLENVDNVCNAPPDGIYREFLMTTDPDNTGSHVLIKRVDHTCPCDDTHPCLPCFFMGEEGMTFNATITLGTKNGVREHTTEADKKCPACSADEPMAHYSVHEMLVSLDIEDTPFRYSPPVGPPINFKVTYNQKTRQQAERPNFSNFGPKWTCNWLGYVNDDPVSSQVTLMSVYLPGGGTELHNLLNNQSEHPDPQSHAILVRTGDGSYERTLPDGTVQYFNHADDATYYPRRVLLTKIKDPANKEVLIGYGTHDRIHTITDALGQVTTIGYNDPSDHFKITDVTEVPLSGTARHAEFHYSNGKLAWIQDEIGIVSSFQYTDGTDSIEYMTTPYGTTHFESGHDATGSWIVITDPEGGRERVEYRDQADIPFEDSNTVPSGFTSAGLNLANSFYWDKKATEGVVGNNYAYSKARITHWLKYPDGTVSGIVASEKAPLENRVWYKYEGQSDTNSTVGMLNANPIQVARVVDHSGTTQVWQYSYTTQGKVVTSLDPKSRLTRFTYHSNGIDLHEVFQRNGMNDELVQSYTNYVLHRPGDEYDASGQSTHYEYNSNGQILLIRNARHEETTFLYGGEPGATAPYGYLDTVTSPAVGTQAAQTKFEYTDGHRRVNAITTADGTVMIERDDLDRVTKLMYPDGKNEEFGYTQSFSLPPTTPSPKVILDLTTSKDRLDRVTTRHYNRNRQMDSVTSPVGTTRYDWCGCGSLNSITDPDANGHTVFFYRDVQGRLTQKLFADGTSLNYLYEGQSSANQPGTTNHLASVTDALGRWTRYTYDIDDNVSDIHYTDASGNALNPPTPSVHYNYGQSYNRMEGMTDGTGPTVFHYKTIGASPPFGAGQLEYVNGPFSSDLVSFTYDELGRIESESVNGIAETVVRDALGRTTDAYNALGHFRWQLDGVSQRIAELDYPNNQRTIYTYGPVNRLKRLEKIENLGSSGENLSTFEYGYDVAHDQITSWTKLLGDNASGLWFHYDDGKRLDIARDAPSDNQATNKVQYVYDPAGNRISDTSSNPSVPLFAGWTKNYGINTLNQITTVALAPSEVGEPPQVLSYDAVGNMTDDGVDKTYEWDAANRLRAVNYVASGDRTEFTYNGLGQRVKITEFQPVITAEIEPKDNTYQLFSTGKRWLPAGVCTITVQGLNPSGGDNTMLIDTVKLDNSLAPNGSFETPSVNGYQNAPAGATWGFSGTAGIAENGSRYGDPTTADGSQMAFVRNHGSFSMSFNASAGIHMVTFKAAQLSDRNDSSQRVRVTFWTAAAVQSVNTFVWCGSQICEQRDGSGANVTRFYARGEHRIGNDAGDNYYTRDHLGSVREVTNSDGVLVAQNDYDPYGNRVVLNGDMDTAIGYTGHYYHAPSGLNLTLYRAFDPKLGRWLSRDPMGERTGVNLYTYVNNDPVNLVDPLGLVYRIGDYVYTDTGRWLNDPNRPGKHSHVLDNSSVKQTCFSKTFSQDDPTIQVEKEDLEFILADEYDQFYDDASLKVNDVVLWDEHASYVTSPGCVAETHQTQFNTEIVGGEKPIDEGNIVRYKDGTSSVDRSSPPRFFHPR